MRHLQVLFAVWSSLSALIGIHAQPPLQNSTSFVIDGTSQCEPLHLPICLERGLKYNRTVFPSIGGMLSQNDAASAVEAFAELIRYGCDTMADFVCMLLASPCVEVRGVAVPVPPCRHVCETARDQCAPLLRQAGVPWPEQFECTKFPAVTDEPVRCAETEMKVLHAVSPATAPSPPVESETCHEVTVPVCHQLGFTHTVFPNGFDQISFNEIQSELDSLTDLMSSGCADDIVPFICGAYFHKCDPATGSIVRPCKETCRRISKECKDTLKELSLGRNKLFSCRDYPSKRTRGACVEDIRAPASPVIMNVTRSAVSQAQVYYHQPEILEVSVKGLEITFFNEIGDDEGTVTVNTENIATIDVMTGTSYTILVRAYNDWGKSSYVDAIIPEYHFDHCEPISMSMCRDFKYQSTQFPNLLGHQFQSDATLQGSQFMPLVQYGCSSDLLPFLCSLYTPPCTRLPSPQGIKPPCRELCESAQGGCEPIMNTFGYTWPAPMNCSVFPSIREVGRRCFNNDDLILQPAEEGRGRIETQPGSSVKAFCSSTTSPNARPQWLDPRGDVIPTRPPVQSFGNVGVYTEHVGDSTEMLVIQSLIPNGMGTYTCQMGEEVQTMVITEPKTCSAMDSNVCVDVLPYDDALYPNFLGHRSPTEAELASYQFVPIISFGCSTANLPLFVCSLFHPTCGGAELLLPCAELCQAAMTECADFILGTQWAWPAHAQCSRFPSAAEARGLCISPIAPPTTPKGATSPPQPATTSETVVATNAYLLTNVTGNDTQTNLSNGTGGELLRRSYAIRERGMVQMFRGWVDVRGQGAPNDFCRVVRTEGKPFFSCLLAGSEEDNLLTYTSPQPSVEWFDPGYSHTWYMRDEDGDGRDDYCRCIGRVPSTVVVCMKAGPNGFEGPDYDFMPENSPDECLFYQADPFFGFE